MIAKSRDRIQQVGTQVAFVHQSAEDSAIAILTNVGLECFPRVSNPDLSLYRAFGLQKMTPLQFLNPLMWLRGIHTAFVRKHGHGKTEGSNTQMPGTFLVHHGRILRSHIYREVWDHPDFIAMAIPPEP